LLTANTPNLLFPRLGAGVGVGQARLSDFEKALALTSQMY
jgi:hypothetical protein